MAAPTMSTTLRGTDARGSGGVHPACLLALGYSKNRILFANPAGRRPQGHRFIREKLTVRLGYDEGKTWPVAKVLELLCSRGPDCAKSNPRLLTGGCVRPKRSAEGYAGRWR